MGLSPRGVVQGGWVNLVLPPPLTGVVHGGRVSLRQGAEVLVQGRRGDPGRNSYVHHEVVVLWVVEEDPRPGRVGPPGVNLIPYGTKNFFFF